MASPEKGPDRPALARLARGFRERTWVTARLTAKAGLKALAAQGRPSRRDGKELDRAKAVEAAVRLARDVEGLKGLMMKVGQMASYLDPSLPPEARQVLSTLQAGSQPMAFEAIDEVLREELGAPAAELFDSFEPEPFAAASIGQVHRARHEDRELAVKVQYPGIEEAIRSDLDTVSTLARIGSVGMALDTVEVFAELRERLAAECDYEAEARYQRAFAELLEGFPGASAPSVVAERSSRRVLSSSFAPGMSFQSFCDSAAQDDKDRAGALIFDVCYSSIHQRCLYNADPHPGNYLFTSEGEVTFLDFGCVKELPLEMIMLWKRIARSVLSGHRRRFQEAVLETGMVARPDRFDWDHHWKVMLYIYEPFMTEGFRFTHDYVRRSYDLMLWDNPNTRHMTFPRTWLWVNRLQWGLNSVLAHLEAAGPWPELWRAAIEAEVVEE